MSDTPGGFDEGAWLLRLVLQTASGDKESDHSNGDNVAAELIEAFGFARFAAAYRSLCDTWWYA